MDVIQVGMGKKDVLDMHHLIQRQIAHAAAGIQQYVVVYQERGSPEPRPNAAAATQYPNIHAQLSCTTPATDLRTSLSLTCCHGASP
jgi:hypothetical protein